MEKVLPQMEIEGTKFVVDVSKHELRELNNPANTISIDDMKDHGTHYSFQFDRERKNFPAPFQFGKDVVMVNVPQMANLDPVGMAIKHGLKVVEVENKRDFEIIVDQQLLSERLQGNLPKINIAGHDFIVDLRLSELRPVTKHDQPLESIPAIDLRGMDLSSDGEYFLVFYNPSTKQVVDIDPKITKLPEDVVMLKIPDELKLDPVGVARQFGLEDTALLRKYPLQKNLEAKIVPLSETGLPKLVEKNRRIKVGLQPKPSKSIKRKRGKKM